MADDYTIDPQDGANAAALVRDILAVHKPERDYSEGSVLGDSLVDGHAIIVAFLRGEIQKVVNRLSLRDAAKQPDLESTRDAVDAILSNFFFEREQGTFAKGQATLHFSVRADCLIARRTRFFRTPQLVFYIDSTTDVLITADSLRPNIGPTGVIVDYVTTIYLTAARVGAQYNVEPGRFTGADQFNSYFTFVENTSKFAFGDSQQTTESFIASSENALSLRAPINPRSIDALLKKQFPLIGTLLTVNYGDPEMQRDLATDPASGTELHVGGSFDIYVRLQTQEVVEAVQINSLTVRADGVVATLRDVNPPSGSFIAAGVKPGQVLVMVAGIPEAPFEYKIEAVRVAELDIRPRVPFSLATDEVLPTPPALTYTIGDNYPTFDNKVTRGPTTDATTSRRFKVFNQATLPAKPLYAVKQVEITNPPGSLDPYRDPITGTVIFTQRANTATLTTPTPGAPLSYQIIGQNPLYGQSQLAVTQIEVGWPAIDLTGLTLAVTYDSLSGFDSVAGYISDDFNRTGGAFPLVRAFHPVYLTFTLPYRARVLPRNSLDVFSPASALTVDEDAVSKALVENINATPFGARVDVGSLGDTAKAASPAIALTYPFTLTYELSAPNGKVYKYATDDFLTLTPDGNTTTARLTNPGDFGLPSTNYYAALARQLRLLGVSDRTARPLALLEAVALERRGV